MKNLIPVLAAVILTACATDVPEPIRNPPPDDIPMEDVQRAPESYHGTTVRWGGSVVAVQNLKGETRLEILSRRLERNGRPRNVDDSEGKFLARIEGFVDPSVYEEGREVTISGRIDGTQEQGIRGDLYKYPVVHTDQIYLWEKRPPPSLDVPSYYYNPFWPHGS